MTEYTNEQLEAWAGLGPWSWSEETICRQIYHFLGPGVLVTTETDGTPWGDSIDQTNATLIAAAPALAAALLAERKAREVEVANLKRLLGVWTGQDDRFQPLLAGNPSAIDDFMAECAEAMKGN